VGDVGAFRANRAGRPSPKVKTGDSKHFPGADSASLAVAGKTDPFYFLRAIASLSVDRFPSTILGFGFYAIG
jgi:hypothetical protein